MGKERGMKRKREGERRMERNGEAKIGKGRIRRKIWEGTRNKVLMEGRRAAWRRRGKGGRGKKERGGGS